MSQRRSPPACCSHVVLVAMSSWRHNKCRIFFSVYIDRGTRTLCDHSTGYATVDLRCILLCHLLRMLHLFLSCHLHGSRDLRSAWSYVWYIAFDRTFFSEIYSECFHSIDRSIFIIGSLIFQSTCSGDCSPPSHIPHLIYYATLHRSWKAELWVFFLSFCTRRRCTVYAAWQRTPQITPSASGIWFAIRSRP